MWDKSRRCGECETCLDWMLSPRNAPPCVRRSAADRAKWDRLMGEADDWDADAKHWRDAASWERLMGRPISAITEDSRAAACAASAAALRLEAETLSMGLGIRLPGLRDEQDVVGVAAYACSLQAVMERSDILQEAGY